MRIKPEIFEVAARVQWHAMMYYNFSEHIEEDEDFTIFQYELSQFACDNLGRAIKRVDNLMAAPYFGTPEHRLFEEYFRPSVLDTDTSASGRGEIGWWWRTDQEPRILALLFMAEIVKDLNKEVD